MKVITKDGFKLPFVGKEKFIELMRIGVGYDRQARTFFISDLDRIEHVKAALAEIIGEEVTFAQSCFICGRSFPCSECRFYGECKTQDIPLNCICDTCLDKPDLYRRYVEKGIKLFKT
ncbi:MAG: hypothetical protein QXJ75_00740 [Candidatus Bathyarchaeia archaeon]